MKRNILVSLGAALVMVFAGTAQAAPVNQETVLSGEVVTVSTVGAPVKEGDPILTVQTLGGPMVAARATVNGIVESVSVAPGAMVERGQVITVINSQ